MKKICISLLLAGCLTTCTQQPNDPTVSELLAAMPALTGSEEYLASPYVAAGDRLYMVGHQDGTFPDHGWHVAGEMGGIWDHPIKLMDGFVVALSVEPGNSPWVLDQASSFVNYPVGNKQVFTSDEYGLVVARSQFVPDQMEGLVVELQINNQSSEPRTISVNFTALVDLTPVWLAERLHLEDARDTIRTEDTYMWAKDLQNDWYTAWSTDSSVEDMLIGKQAYSPDRQGLGMDGTLRSQLEVPGDGSATLRYFIAGSDSYLADAVETMDAMQSDYIGLLQEKTDRYQEMTQRSQITVPDQQLTSMYDWTKYNTDWLMRDVPGQGRGLSAGMADYPWWFGADNCYSLQGLLATGQHEEVYSTIELIMKLSKDANGDNGRIMHEASTNGVVYNPGNLNETPHFIYLLWKVFEWTGDEGFLRTYYDQAEAGLQWIMEQDHDGNGYADGPGMMEIPGLHTEMIDVVVYTQQAAWALGQMAEALEMTSEAARYDSIADALQTRINSEWWSGPSNSYADFRATKAKTLELIDAAIIRSDTIDKPWAVEELRETRAQVQNAGSNAIDSRVVYHNWVVNTPMEMGIADPDKAQRALQEGRKYRSKYGVYVTGLDRDESQAASSKWEVFSYVGAVMTLPTGVQALAEANYGNIEESYEYMTQLTNSFGYALPGSTYEVSPDYGMMSQAWNIYAVAVPIVTKYFGIQPQAHKRQVIIRPNMPSQWTNAAIEQVRVGDNYISLKKESAGSEVTFEITQQDSWDLLFYPPPGFKVESEGAGLTLAEDGAIKLTNKTNIISLSAL